MNKKIITHFQRVDPTLFSLFQTMTLDEQRARPPRQYFVSLVSEIIGQQLSGRVADVLFERFKKMFRNRHITPHAVLKLSEESLRSTGMSWSKARFIRDLAQKVLAKLVKLDKLAQLPDDAVIRELTKVKGIGPWTAEMFLMFTLGRDDVFSYGDLGLRKAMKKVYGFRKDPTLRQRERIVNTWKPYRTWAARILWKSLEG